MAKRRKSRRSRHSRRGLGCVGCGPAAGQATLAGFGFSEPRPVFKYALYAAVAYFAYVKVLKPRGGLAGLGAIFSPPANGADSLNRPGMPGQVIEIPRGF